MGTTMEGLSIPDKKKKKKKEKKKVSSFPIHILENALKYLKLSMNMVSRYQNMREHGQLSKLSSQHRFLVNLLLR